jgi:arylsulfatase A-like enzyme
VNRPNVLLICTDQQRPDLYGAAGRVAVQTPAADRVAAEGMMLSRTYAACPLCTPSRATLVSGQYPTRHRTWGNGMNAPEEMLSLPSLLSEQAGYRTALIGKSHLQACMSPDVDTYTWQYTREPPRVYSREAPPNAHDWEYFRSWHGPWYGFEHATISVGHTYDHNGYTMHYGLWLQDNGIPMADPYFMSREEAEIRHGDHGIPGLRNRKGGERATDGHPATWDLPEEFHSSTWVANATIAYLRDHVASHGDRPFYVSMNIPDPHQPLIVPAPWDTLHDGVELPPPMRRLGEWEGKSTLYRASIEDDVGAQGWHDFMPPSGMRPVITPTNERTPQEERWWRTYMGMQSLADKHMGRVLDELDALGLADDTLVMVTSDHGDYMGDHFVWGKGPGHYVGAAGVPLIVRWPGRVPAGSSSAGLQSLVDLPTTVMRAAGLDPHPEMQGVDQLPVWTGDAESARESVLIDHRAEARLHVHSLITDRHRLSIYSDSQHARTELELFDLQEDPFELDSLANDPGHVAVVNELVGEATRQVVGIQGPWLSRTSGA